MARIVDGPEITGQVVHRQTGQAYGPVTVTVSPKVYTDREMTSSVTSLTTDGQGVYSCYAPPGVYTFTTTAADAGTLEPVEVLGKEGGTGGVTGSAASTGFSPLSRLAGQATHRDVNVMISTPAAGTSTTLHTLTGVGIVDMFWLTIEAGSLAQDAVLEVYVDGEAVPSISADLGTLFMTHLDARGVGQSLAGDHMLTGTHPARPNVMDGAILFPIPYSNGCIIKLRNPATGTTGGGTANALFTQVQYRPGAVSTYRLKSIGITQLNKLTAAYNQQIQFFDLKNLAGSLVWLSYAATGSGGNSYLERQWWFAVDGEATTPDGNGVITPSYATSGGEDLFLNGYFFMGKSSLVNPWTICTANGNANFTSVAGFDFLRAHGGVKCSNELKAGWSLKPAGFVAQGHTMSWVALYYVDTTVPFVPDVPTGASAAAGNAQATVTWTPPQSSGSQPITGYTVTSSPGGFTATVGAAATTATVTGLTNGTAYTFTVKATNSIGDSNASAASNSVTPAASSVPGAPTGLSATAGNAQNVLNWSAPGSNGGSAITNYKVYQGTSSGGETLLATVGNVLTYTVTGLTNGTTYYYKVSAVNANGEGALSSEATGTPAGVAVSDNFNAADTTTGLAGRVTPTGAKTWAVTQTNGVVAAGISSNQAYFSSFSLSASGFATVDAGVADCTLQVDMTAAYTDAGLAFRVVDASNNFSTSKTGIGRRISGTFSSIGTFSSAFTTGDTMIIVLSGSSITVKQVRSGSTTTVLTVTDANFTTATKHGITAFNDTAARFDNFQVS